MRRYIKKQKRISTHFIDGMSVTNPLKNSACYEDGEWFRKELTDDFVEDVLRNSKKSYSTLFFYAVGVYVTAYARRNVYLTMLRGGMDRDLLYIDTDSMKYKGNHDDVFIKFNEGIREKYKRVCERFSQLNLSDFEPLDPKGKKHPLGFFEFETVYEKFVTLGAKRYAYVEDGELHITVSGVNKKGASALSSIEDFKNGFTWGYHESGKLAHYYTEEQPHDTITDYEGNDWTNTYDYGVVLQPTTYTLGISHDYLALISYFESEESYGRN